MENLTISEKVKFLKKGFQDKKNFTLKQRLFHLDLLEKAITSREKEIQEALQNDFNKPHFETFLSEIFPVLDEIKHFKKNLRFYMQPERVKTPLFLLPASGKKYAEPKGTVLIIGAWNYPINLTLIPLVGAIAGGNTVLLKPSEIAVNSSKIVNDIISSIFPSDIVQVIEGDGVITTEILQNEFDHIFYTGSTQVGKIIYQKAAEKLTPVTLELGGKSPAIFHDSANLKRCVKRLLWGKFLNGGQTCVAPDYALIPKSLKSSFLSICKDEIKFYLTENESSVIVNQKHFDRITALLNGNHEVHFGGDFNRETRYISPTIVEICDTEDLLMSEEIFGPILPVYFYDSESDIARFYNKNPNPLSLYIFSDNKTFTEKIIENFPSGGVVINDVIMHLAHANLPFGGRGFSGFGNYHGAASFQTFTHTKSVMKQVNWIDPNLRYRPYTEKKANFLKKLIALIHKF
jgi:aldehyde dehydrogenase (NAD+)